MRIWQRWWQGMWQTIVFISEYDPPQFAELLMLLLAMLFMLISSVRPEWPYWVLGLSFIVGSSTSILIRESMVTATRPRPTQIFAGLLLVASGFGFTELLRYVH